VFNLTPQERQVILFLATVALAGMGINFFAKNFSSVKVIAYLNQDISKIGLNQADKATLMSVSGIGEKIAQRILEYRNQEGSFHDIEELRRIKGLTKSKYEKIRDEFVIR
jgi:competence ComEA-like helix-hairpin-helix protein